jgi:Phosphotransferase enzyme family
VEVPSWAVEWCREVLGATPVEQLLVSDAIAEVRAVRLDDGRAVVLKARVADDARRASGCVEVQRLLAEQGFPCPRPLSLVTVVGERAVHAEEWRPGGEKIREDGPEAATRSAWLLGDLMRRLEGIRADPLLPNPEWVGWDHEGPGDFPPNPRHDPLAARTPLPAVILETAPRVRARLLKAALRPVVGHADWEAQNMRWAGTEPHVVYDWDSLAWLPEAAVVGAAAGMFASAEGPILAPLESSMAFLDAYQVSRGRTFSVEEREVAWAASIWPALYNAREEILHDVPSVALTALDQQADRRLSLAGA